MAGRTQRQRNRWLGRHSLSIVAIALLLVWIIGYRMLDPKTHLGSFFGNAIADWSGSVVIILGTKFFIEVGSAESRPARGHKKNRWLDLLWRHSLLIVIRTRFERESLGMSAAALYHPDCNRSLVTHVLSSPNDIKLIMRSAGIFAFNAAASPSSIK